MQNKKFKPLIGKTFYVIWIPTILLLLAATVISFWTPLALVILVSADIFVGYFMFSSIAGYVELRENEVFVKFGFMTSVEIPYENIRGFSKERKLYSDSMLSIKNSLEHINIKYNKIAIVSVSVVNNDELISDIEERIEAKKAKKY